jgi:hypothetical protein
VPGLRLPRLVPSHDGLAKRTHGGADATGVAIRVFPLRTAAPWQAWAMGSLQVFRVTGFLLTPTQIAMPPGGGPPPKLVPIPRLTPSVRQYGSLTVAFLTPPTAVEWPGIAIHDPNWRVMQVVADVPTEMGEAAAVEDVGAALSPILDMASFLLAAPVRLGQLQVVEITPPVSVGDARPMRMYSSAPFDRNARGVSMQALAGLSSLSLPLAVPTMAPRVAAALRWFVKSLSTDLLHDQFMFLWIALEVLCDLSGVTVTGPYLCTNGHPIPECPECHASTTKPVRGQSIRRFLQDSGGIDSATGKELWGVRQMMHGAVDFDSKKLERLPALVQILRAAVAMRLKEALGFPADFAPFVQPEGLMIHPSAMVVGTQALAADDLLSLDELAARSA